MAELPARATPEEIAAAQAREAAGAAAAAAQNAAWRNNTLPVLPVMGNPAPQQNPNELIRIYDTTGLSDPRNQQGVARDVTAKEYYAIYGRTPEESERQKYQSFNAPIDYAALQGMSLSAIASKYGSNTADRVQDYYAAHPTAAFQALTGQYAANKAGGLTASGGAPYMQGSFTPTVLASEGGFSGKAAEYAKNWVPLSTTLDAPNTRAAQKGERGIDYPSISGLNNPFDPKSAAGITWDVAKSGGTVGASVAAAALPDFAKAGISNVPEMWVSRGSERSTVPVSILDTSKWFSQPTSIIIPGQDMYFRIGDSGTTQLKENAKMVYADTGAFSILQVVPNNIPGSSFTRIYPWLTAGGSDYALQGGAVTGSPLVRDTDTGKLTMARVVDEFGLNKLYTTGSREDWLSQQISQHPGDYTKAGRELGGGAVQPNANLYSLQDEFAKGNIIMPGRYAQDLKPYANLVTIEAENAPKGSIPGEANLPQVGDVGIGFGSMPAVQKVDMKGTPTGVYPSWLYNTVSFLNPPKNPDAPREIGSTGVYAVPVGKFEGGGSPRSTVTVTSVTDEVARPIPATTGGWGDLFKLNASIAGIIGSKTGAAGALSTVLSLASQNISGAIPTAENTTVKKSESVIFGGSNQTIQDMRTNLDLENKTVTGMYEDLSNRAKGNVSGSVWTGSQGDYEKYKTDVGKYSTAADALKANATIYNKMDEQNPATKTVITNVETSTSGGVAGTDQYPGLTWLQKMYDNIPLRAAVGGFVGTSGYGYATAPTGGALGEIGAAAFGGESATAGVLASNPVGWGVGVGIGAVMLAEKAGVLGLTGETAGMSVRTAGGYAAQELYKAGFSYMGKIRSDVSTMNDMAGNVANIVNNNNPLERIGGGGAGGRGATVNMMNIGTPFAGSELPNKPMSRSELPENANSYSEIPNRASAFSELPASLPAYKEVTQTGREVYNILERMTSNPNQEKNQNQNDYGNKIRAENERGLGYPVGSPTGEPVRNPNPTNYPFGLPITFPNPLKTPTNNPSSYTLKTQTSNPYQITTDNPNKYETNTNNPDQPQPKKIDTPKILIPQINLGAGGGGSGVAVRGGMARAYQNRFLYGQGLGNLDFGDSSRLAMSRISKRTVSIGTHKKKGGGR